MVNSYDVWYPKMKRAQVCGDDELDILVHDENWFVRQAVVERNRAKDFDILIHDPVWNIREHIAIYGRDKDLDILVNDKSLFVRAEVYRHGRQKDKVKYDKDPDKKLIQLYLHKSGEYFTVEI